MLLSRNRVLLSLFALLTYSCLVQSEYFSSVDSLVSLEFIQQDLVVAAKEYLKENRREVDIIKKYLGEVQAKHQVARKNVETYLGNPLNAFTLIKRMVEDWEELHQLILEKKPSTKFQSIMDDLYKDLGLPDHNDVSGAAKGLARIQEVYNYNASYLAEGDLYANYKGSELTWRDCYEIGVQLFEAKYYQMSLGWFDQALLLMDTAVDFDDSYELDIYEYLAIAFFQLGDKEKAFYYINMILEFQPNHKAQQTKTYFELLANDTTQAEPHYVHDYFANYTRLCQGIAVTEPDKKPLSCYLDNSRHAYFRLAPLKVEPLNLDPSISLYHNILNDNQINKILAEGYSLEMSRSRVAGGTTGSGIVRDIRVSQQTWLDYDSPIMRHIKNLVHLVSGFDMRGVEKMQLANYGIGGLYEPHHDYFKVNVPTDYIGDRISTSMFYLSNVDLGGYTVFPKVNVFSKPVKGALVMWYNLHRSLEPDVRTLHAGCPLIKGSKRIGNVWMHSGWQEFARPCELVADDYKNDAFERT